MGWVTGGDAGVCKRGFDSSYEVRLLRVYRAHQAVPRIAIPLLMSLDIEFIIFVIRLSCRGVATQNAVHKKIDAADISNIVWLMRPVAKIIAKPIAHLTDFSHSLDFSRFKCL